MESSTQPPNDPTTQPSFTSFRTGSNNLTTQSPNHPITQPSDHPTAQSPTLFVGGVWAIVLAAFLLLCGLGACAFYLIMPLAARPRANVLETNVICGALAGFGIVFGAVLAWQGLNAARGRASMLAARAFPPVIILVGAFLGAVLLGVAALALSGAEAQPLAAYAFPPWHFVSALVLPLAFLAYGARRLGAASGLRALVVSFGWGALGATTLALLLEIAIGAILVLLAAVVLSLQPNSEAMLEDLRARLQLAQSSNDLTSLVPILSNPAVIAGALFFFAVVIPLLEESVKALVVAFADPLRTRAADAVLWGMSAGAGFAVLENLFNASVSLEGWGALMLLRVGATSIHVSNGATIGRGWYAARVERRWGQLVSAYLVSVLIHALWNAAAIGLGGSALFLTENARASFESLLPVGVLVIALVTMLIVLSALGMVRIVRAVHRAQSGVMPTV